jgi:hypothetical protein
MEMGIEVSMPAIELKLKTLKVPTKLHHALKAAALEDDVPLGALVLNLLVNGLELREADMEAGPEPDRDAEVPT